MKTKYITPFIILLIVCSLTYREFLETLKFFISQIQLRYAAFRSLLYANSFGWRIKTIYRLAMGITSNTKFCQLFCL